MPAPSGQIPPPWVRWENETPTTRAACRPAPGHSRCDLRDPAAPWRYVRAFSAQARGRGERITAVRARVTSVNFSGGRADGGDDGARAATSGPPRAWRWRFNGP